MAHKSQVKLTYLIFPDAVMPLDMSWGTKVLLTLAVNMHWRKINLFESFTGRDISDMLNMTYSTQARAKKFLKDNGYIAADGEMTWHE